MNRDLRRRLARLEEDRHQGAPAMILADRPLERGEGADLLERWQEIVQSGEGSVSGKCLVLTSPKLTVEEWEKRYAEPFSYQ